MSQKKERSQALLGVKFQIDACRCTECGRIVTSEPSIERGCGPRCWEKAHGVSPASRLEAQGQMRLPLTREARA